MAWLVWWPNRHNGFLTISIAAVVPIGLGVGLEEGRLGYRRVHGLLEAAAHAALSGCSEFSFGKQACDELPKSTENLDLFS